MTEQAPKGVTVIVGQWRWASGANLAEAKKGWTRRGGKLSNGYTVLTFDADTEFHGIDSAARYHYRGNPPEVQEVAPRARKAQH